MSRNVNLCDKGWQLYDVWDKLCVEKESLEHSDKSLDRQIAGARQEMLNHTLECSECVVTFSEGVGCP